MNQHDKVQEQFNKQAAVFSQQPTIANPDHTQWMLDYIELKPEDKVLDVAAGTGHLSRAIAPYVRQVTALDLTSAMIEQGQIETQQAGLHNIHFEQGVAENLTYPDASFDVVVTRFSLHHFETPIAALCEMHRVLKASGRIAVIDLVSPDNLELAAAYNHFERLRDPSHTTAFASNALLNIVAEAGFDEVQGTARDIEVDLNRWLNLTQTPPEARKLIQDNVGAELTGGKMTGMRPFRHDNTDMFLHRWMVVTGIK
ncbi:MAG: methyltransferase domain-containing protein [Chloroflexota bacterium]